MTSQKKSNPKKQTPLKNKTKPLAQLIAENQNFQFIDNGKIKCILTNHEMAATEENYLKYLQSKSYKKGLESVFDISLYEDILVDHKGNEGYFFCQLTGVKVPKKKSAIEKHVNGKKFQRRFKQAQQDESEEGIDFQKIAELEEADEEEQEEEEKKTKSSKKNKKQEHLTSRKEAAKTKKISKDNKHGKNQKKQQKGHKQNTAKAQGPNTTETVVQKSSNSSKKSSNVSSKQIKTNKTAKKNK